MCKAGQESPYDRKEGWKNSSGDFHKKADQLSTYQFDTFVLVVHVELKGALEANGPEIVTRRASGLVHKSCSAEKENEV